MHISNKLKKALSRASNRPEKTYYGSVLTDIRIMGEDKYRKQCSEVAQTVYSLLIEKRLQIYEAIRAEYNDNELRRRQSLLQTGRMYRRIRNLFEPCSFAYIEAIAGVAKPVFYNMVFYGALPLDYSGPFTPLDIVGGTEQALAFPILMDAYRYIRTFFDEQEAEFIRIVQVKAKIENMAHFVANFDEHLRNAEEAYAGKEWPSYRRGLQQKLKEDAALLAKLAIDPHGLLLFRAYLWQ